MLSLKIEQKLNLVKSLRQRSTRHGSSASCVIETHEKIVGKPLLPPHRDMHVVTPWFPSQNTNFIKLIIH